VKPRASTGETADLRAARRRIKLLEQENEVLRRAAAYLSQANLAGKGLDSLVSELAADGVGLTVRSYGSRLSPGSNGPTTADGDRPPSAD
jgi:hypothetical protein